MPLSDELSEAIEKLTRLVESRNHYRKDGGAWHRRQAVIDDLKERYGVRQDRG